LHGGNHLDDVFKITRIVIEHLLDGALIDWSILRRKNGASVDISLESVKAFQALMDKHDH
jgi:hypothetical protein